ncbi:hypothetical protein LTR84_012046 [Exophiala bonariae]|uniref:HTH TFE/IIEalpha-type domain-containing protein n=1 Tax=Exophiala bonariae TaxID=1690606 RepID=A0AAV9NIR7_9EURO|nr:hypothetical protein LTR84_012046 [Exophiala bonariae]
MEEAKTLIRTTVRTFFTHPKQILIIDALMLHSVLHIEDLAVLLSTQPKDIRALINPLRSARLLTTHSRVEVRVGTQRGVTRDYYYCPFHPAIDAIKYRIAKLRKRVNDLYKEDETKRKDWRCPRCKAEYEELDILDKIGDDGFFCDRCGATLVQNMQALKDKGSHEKILKLNSQLKKFDDIIHKIDHKTIPENDFISAWERKKDVPRERGGREPNQYMELKRDDKNAKRGPDMVKTENLAVNLTSGAEQDREEAEKKEERRKLLAKQNQLPAWHTSSAIGLNAGGVSVKSEGSGTNGLLMKKEEELDEKKPLDLLNNASSSSTAPATTNTMQDEVAAYMAEMEREREEAEKRAKEEDEEEDEDFEFEDVVGTSVVGTPASSSQPTSSMAPLNGVKREFDDDSSDANTPASFDIRDRERDSKRVKFENGSNNSSSMNRTVAAGVKVEGFGQSNIPSSVKPEGDADSEEDEDFEDAI